MLIDRYWKELDEIIGRIITKQELEDGLDKGRAEAACLFIAILLRPHNPDLIGVRNQALKRYKERNAT